jgi:hypothetical protein
MRTRVVAALTWLLAGCVIVAAQAPTTTGLPWIGSADAIATYIRGATIQKLESLPVGVTKPQQAILAPGGPISSIVVKDLRPGRKSGYWESYQSEIAAYELDRMLELNMVPPTVEKRVNGTLMSAQMFIDRCVFLKELKGQQPPDVTAWNRQIHRQRVWDNLIANIDRNAGNLLVLRTPDWHLVLIDHSRCFTATKKMAFEMKQIDRPFFERLKALDAATLEARIGPLLAGGLDTLMQRRDAIVRHFEQLAATSGAERVFTP